MIDRRLNYGRHVIRDFIKKSGESSLPEVIVDIGAGKGIDLANAGDIFPDAKLFGLENYKPNVDSLEEKNIQVVDINIENESFPFEDETIDIVIANQIFEHCKEIFWVVSECTRSLKVGGHLVIGVPNLAAAHNRMLLLLGRHPTCIQTDSAHIRGFTQHDMIHFMEACFPGGLRLKKFAGSNYYPFPGVIAKVLASVLSGSATSIFFCFEKLSSYDNQFLSYPIDNRLETNFWLGSKLTA